MNTIQQFLFSLNLLQAILWQYQNASNLQSLIQAKQNWYEINQTQFWEDWEANVFDLFTADEFGLYVWSIILGLPNFINQGSNSDEDIFGFGGTNGTFNFENGILSNDQGSSVVLPLATQRLGLQFRYFQFCSSGTVPEINRFLAYLFGQGQAWLIDHEDMTQTYIFNFSVSWDRAYLFNNYDLLPRPAGVGSNWIDATIPRFGFDTVHLSFDQAPLGS